VSASLPQSTATAEPPLGEGLKVSAYESVASWLIALLILIGLGVGLLLFVYFTSRIFVPQQAVPVTIQQVGGGTENGVIGESKQLDSPDPQQVAQETDLREPELQKTLETVTAAVATRKAELVDPNFVDEAQRRSGPRTKGTGSQVGRGQGDGLSGYPPAQRWEIRFSEGNTLEGYAKELAFFNIELGVLGSTNQVVYVTNLAKSKPDQRVGQRDKEDRLYMSWRAGKLRDADRELCQRAGVATEGRLIVQFYPAQVEQQLLQLEKKFAGRDASQIRRTRFGVRAAGKGFEFYVIDQTPLAAR